MDKAKVHVDRDFEVSAPDSLGGFITVDRKMAHVDLVQMKPASEYCALFLYDRPRKYC